MYGSTTGFVGSPNTLPRKKITYDVSVATIAVIACALLALTAISRSSMSKTEFINDQGNPLQMRHRGLEFLLEMEGKKYPNFSNVSIADAELLFSGYISKFSRAYVSDFEKNNRFENFLNNLRAIDRNNAANIANGGEAVHGITLFSDMSDDEFATKYLTAKMPTALKKTKKLVKKVKTYPPRKADMPVSADWTGIYTTPVNSQGSCGGCWAVSTTEQTESDAIRAGLLRPNQPLSFQQLLSCDQNDYGCQGGWTETGFEYVSIYGLSPAAEYPFEDQYDSSSTSSCNFIPVESDITITNLFELPSEEDMISHVLTTGPLSVCLDASTWQSYTGGVLKTCPMSPDHCVQAVGVNTQENWWKIRNSWGTSWGDNGFIFLELGQNMCYITADPQYTEAALVQHATVTVDIISANGLKNRNWFSNSNPYVVVTLGALVVQTTIVQDNLNPVWNQSFTINWDGIAPLSLQVMDHGFFLGLSNVPLGSLDVDLLSSSIPTDKVVQYTQSISGNGADTDSTLTFSLILKPLKTPAPSDDN